MGVEETMNVGPLAVDVVSGSTGPHWSESISPFMPQGRMIAIYKSWNVALITLESLWLSGGLVENAGGR